MRAGPALPSVDWGAAPAWSPASGPRLGLGLGEAWSWQELPPRPPLPPSSLYLCPCPLLATAPAFKRTSLSPRQAPLVPSQPTCGHVLTALTTQFSSISTFRGSGAQPTCGVPCAGAPGGLNRCACFHARGWGAAEATAPKSQDRGRHCPRLPAPCPRPTWSPTPWDSREGTRGKSAARTRPPGHCETAGGTAHHLDHVLLVTGVSTLKAWTAGVRGHGDTLGPVQHSREARSLPDLSSRLATQPAHPRGSPWPPPPPARSGLSLLLQPGAVLCLECSTDTLNTKETPPSSSSQSSSIFLLVSAASIEIPGCSHCSLHPPGRARMPVQACSFLHGLPLRSVCTAHLTAWPAPLTCPPQDLLSPPPWHLRLSAVLPHPPLTASSLLPFHLLPPPSLTPRPARCLPSLQRS